MSVTDLEIRIEKIERMLKKYAGPIEPRSGEFMGQEWFNTATEVLYKWTGREYAPAYGKSIISTIEGLESSITQTAEQIELKVSKGEVISSINISDEEITISAARVNISQIFAQDITATGTITGLTLQSPDYTPLGTGGWIIDSDGITVRGPEAILQEVVIRQGVIDVQNMTNQGRTRILPGSMTLRTPSGQSRSIIVNNSYMSIPNLETNRLYLGANDDYYLQRFSNTLEWFDGNSQYTIMTYQGVTSGNPGTPTHRIRFNNAGTEYWIPAIPV